MNKILLLSITAFFLLTGFVSADCIVGQNGIDVHIVNNTVIVEGYACVGVQTYNSLTGQYITTPQKFISSTSPLFINRVNESMGSTIVCDEFNITQGNTTNKYYQNCKISTDYTREIPFLGATFNSTNQSQPIVTDIATQDKYEQCLLEKAQFVSGMNSCVESKNRLSSFEANYTSCSTDLVQCRADKGVAETERNTLKTDAEAKKNQPYIWGAAALVIGVLCTLWWKGEIGGKRAKSPEEKYNTHQSM